MYRMQRDGRGVDPSPLAALLGAEVAESCLRDMHAFIAGDSELAPLFSAVDPALLQRWLLSLLDQVLGGATGTDPRCAPVFARLTATPDLEARFVNYLSGTLLLRNASRSTVADLRSGLLPALRDRAAAARSGRPGAPGAARLDRPA